MSQTVQEARFKVGDTYMTRGKHPRTCTVQDVLYTYNSKGELVHIRYVTSHELMGQTVVEHDVREITIMMGRM
jgi:hypothetical protein